MWEPDPAWERLPAGPSSHGVWRASGPAGPVVVKRLRRPDPHDSGHLTDPGHAAWWRRAADVALAGGLSATPGLRAPQTLRVDEDEEGITLHEEWVEDAGTGGLFVARALGRFAGADLPDRPWHARRLLPDRIRMVEQRGGWQVLARTTAADVAAHLWARRTALLERVAELPQVPQHGDPVPANLPGRAGDEAVAIDWSTLGRGPVGADLGYLSLSAREEFGPLLDAYVDGLPAGLATREQARLGAQVMAVLTVLTRADWALAQVAHGEGALAGKYRHPAVAPHLRTLQRQLPQVEALLA